MIINANGVNVDTTRSNSEINSLIDSKISSFVKIQTGSYIGNGSFGEDNPKTLTFNFVPKIVLIWKADTGMVPYSNEGWVHSLFWVTGATYSTMQGRILRISLSNKTLSIYSTESASYQMNENTMNYNWLALG